MHIRLFSQPDLATLVKIQNASAPAAAWGEGDYERLAADPLGMILVAEQDGSDPGELIGFAAFHRVGEEAELWNLAVVPQSRRQGIAQALLQEAARRLLAAGAAKIFLEVRASNTPALRLYEVAGGKTVGRRRDYYQNPQEDALMLVLDLAPHP